MEDRDRYHGWFDVDSLKTITQEALRDSVKQCQSVIVLLNGETFESEWCDGKLQRRIRNILTDDSRWTCHTEEFRRQIAFLHFHSK